MRESNTEMGTIMKKQSVELLAPAGNYECFQAAMNAGADAVYLGGTKFGARAYAGNFTEQEIIRAIRTAHILQKKVYLTVNTLVKEKEFAELVPYIKPFYEAGLDGAIIQDFGVLKSLGRHFPGMELHASTQMTVTGAYGAKLLKEQGVCRVVPARELSLEEISEIKKETGLEIEAFVHGAMCYAYSGQCLFSSILGGRSGNRGRCAGPCRLPYKTMDNKTAYPLSLKDMYTLSMIPKLLQAGIDSFKIEGRMKSPEYVAGVTALYRKYMDLYLKNSDDSFAIDKKDEDILRKLYIRTDICHGYYEQHNGKNMVTIKEPGYSGCDQEVLQDIQARFLTNRRTRPILGRITVKAGEPAHLELFTQVDLNQEGTQNAEVLHAEAWSETVSIAQNRPLSTEEIENRMGKMGDTQFRLEKLEVETDGKSFLPVKALNELRRVACGKLEEIICATDRDRRQSLNTDEETKKLPEERDRMDGVKLPSASSGAALYVLASTVEQIKAVTAHTEIEGIYVSADIFLAQKEEQDRIVLLLQEYKKPCFLAMPPILRKRSYHYLKQLEKLLSQPLWQGVLVRNLETVEWLREIGYTGCLIADYSLYAWNREADSFLERYFQRNTVPLELNRKEIKQLQEPEKREIVVYGRIPLMYSANCVQKTLGRCEAVIDGTHRVYYLTDRYQNQFPVLQNCLHCFNILYNTVPMSLHTNKKVLFEEGFAAYRIEFTMENKDETNSILQYYIKTMVQGKEMEFPIENYTNGHYKRGVE